MLKAGVEKLFKMREEASRKRPGADEGFDPHEKPFLDHLEDLRHMLVKIGATLAIATIACFAFHKQIFKLIQLPATMPLANVSEGVTLLERLDLITLSPPEFIVLMLKLSFFSGVIITFPFLLYFIFQFILPGLRQAEKRAVIPGAAVGFILFLVGVAFAFFLAAPVALKFFYVFENERISNLDPTERAMEKSIAEIPLIGLDGTKYPPAKEDAEAEESGSSAETLTPAMRDEVRNMIRESFATIEASNIALRYDDTRGKLVIVESKGGRSIYRIGEYITFIARLVLVFGISFQLPVVVSILVKLELLTARVMRSTRTYAWIIIMVAAAILTPPDLMTLGLLAG
ncbi:MAG: twin-arginine translocase subunit TatC, partial [Verrucomicrobiota bacterium]